MNVVESLERASSFLEKHGVESARLNAELLLSSLLAMSRVELYTRYDRPLTDEEAGLFSLQVARRARGYPLQYQTRRAGFRGLDLEVRPGVFIPRPETEVLVEKALEVMPAGAASVLDLCTGCGNIAVSVAVEHGAAKVTATDIDWLAVVMCMRNAARCGVFQRVRAIEGDLYCWLSAIPDGRFDVIVSNPPYVPSERWRELPVEVREHEPMEALLGGEDGLDVVRRIVSGAPGHLNEHGWVVIEIDEGQVDAVAGDILRGWKEVRSFEDMAGRPRVVRARLA